MYTLDLLNANRPTYDITMPTGETIHVLPCTKRKYDLLATASNDEISALLAEILSNNKEGIKYTADKIDEFDTYSAFKILRGYRKFVIESIIEDPN